MRRLVGNQDLWSCSARRRLVTHRASSAIAPQKNLETLCLSPSFRTHSKTDLYCWPNRCNRSSRRRLPFACRRVRLTNRTIAGGLAGLTCELVLRGAGARDNRQFINDLENLGVERGESVADVHLNFRGATHSKNLMGALSIYADLLRRPHLPADLLEASRLTALQELAAVEDEPSQKVMLELRRRHLPDPWGRPSQGQREALEAVRIEEIKQYFTQQFRPNGTILGVAGRIEWPELKEQVGKLFADWPEQPIPTITETPAGAKRHHMQHESNQTQIGIAYPSVPYRDPDYFQAWRGHRRAQRRHEFAVVYRGSREARTVLQRLRHAPLAAATGAAFSVTPAPAPNGPRKRSTSRWRKLIRLADGIEPGELARLKARIKSGLIMQQESSSARSSAHRPRLVSTWAASGRWTRSRPWSTR